MWPFKKKEKATGNCETCLHLKGNKCKRYPKEEMTDKTNYCGEYDKKN